MKNNLDIDNPFFTFMGALADLVILNLLFVLFSLPIVTMGASLSSMYQTCRKMRDQTLGSVPRYFIKAFCSSLKKTVPAWMLQLICGGILLFDLAFIARASDTAYWHVVGMLTGCIFLLWMMVSCYLIPARVYEDKKVIAAVSESLCLAVRNLPYTLLMALLNIIPLLCVVFGAYFMMLATPVYLTCGFGVTAFLNTLLLEKCRGGLCVGAEANCEEHS